MTSPASTTDTATAAPEKPRAEETRTEQPKASFTDRIKSDPEFALGTVQNLQRQLSELQNRVKPLETVEHLAKSVARGNVDEGVNQLIALADRSYRIDQNPQWKQAVEDLIAGKRVVPTQVEQQEDEYLTPEERKIRLLESELSGLRSQVLGQEQRMARSEIQGHFETFFKSDLGQALEPQERSDLVSAINTQLTTWGSTPDGRKVLSNLSTDTIETVALKHLKDRGLLGDVYGRLRQGVSNRLASAATDGPSIGSRQSDPGIPEFKNATEALKYASQKFLEPDERQRVGW